MTIAQIVHDNEMYFGLSEADIHNKVRIFGPISVTYKLPGGGYLSS
jgi:hypothetical protein